MNCTNMNKLPFGKKNYQLMVAGLLVVATGFTLMAIDKEQFGWLGLTLGPIVVMAGFFNPDFFILPSPQGKQETPLSLLEFVGVVGIERVASVFAGSSFCRN